MKQDSTLNDFKKVFLLGSGAIVFCVFAGILIANKYPDSVFSEGVSVLSRISFEKTTFSKAFFRSMCMDFAYCCIILLFSTGFPGIFVPGMYIITKSFFLGVTTGLASGFCTADRAIHICFAVFASNILILPLYLMLFFISLNYSAKVFSDGVSPSHNLKGYLLFAAKVFTVFILMCIAECIQSALGIFILKTVI